MFDVSFTELLVIGAVALVFIGPEKLPRVARTVGHLMGRAQRYVNEVKRDIRQELDAADQASGGLMTLKEDMQQAARELEHSIADATREATQSLRQPLQEVEQAVQQLGQELNPAQTASLTQSAETTPADGQAEAAVAKAQEPAPNTAAAAATTETITQKNPPHGGQP